MEKEAQGWPAFPDHTQENTILAFFSPLFEINVGKVRRAFKCIN